MKKTNTKNKKFRVVEKKEIKEKNNLQEILRITYLILRNGQLYR